MKTRGRFAAAFRAGLASLGLVVIFVFALAVVWRIAVPIGIDARLIFFIFGVPLLILGFALLSGWVFIKFSLVADCVSAAVASVTALISLYPCVALIFMPGYRNLLRDVLLDQMLSISLLIIPAWLMFICAVGFARID